MKTNSFKSLILIILFFMYTVFLSSRPTILKVIIDCLLIIVSIYAFRSELKSGLKSIFNKKTLLSIFVGFIVILIIQAVSSAILSNLLSVQSPVAILQSLMLKKYPIYMIFLMLIFSPIVEEITFRSCFRSIISNKFVFVGLSSVIYAVLSMMSALEMSNSLLYLIPSILNAVIYSVLYLKRDNIVEPIILHFLVNLWALIAYFSLI